MLSWQQVVPFLDHADKRVVARAAQYLADARGLSVEVTERICNLMDRDDLKDLDYASDWSPRNLFNALAAAPPTMDSVKRLVACSTRGDEARQEDAQPTLRQIDFEFLRDHREELLGMAELNQAIRQGWSERLELINADLEQLWQWFISRSEESGAAWEQKMAQFPPKSDQFDWDRIDRLIEAMARHSNSVERAMKILTDPSIEDWREIYAVRLLGVMRHEPATDLILSKLLIEDADLLHEEVVRSLAKIGTVSVVHKIEAFIPDKDWGVRIFADDPLEHIRLPEAEAALIRLLQREPESDVRTDLASSLCGQCATEGIGLIQDMVTKEEWDPQIADLDVDLLVTCIMIGRELPGAEEIEKVAKARREDRARRMKQFGPAKSLSSKDRDRVNWEPESPEFSEPVATIQRDSPKIGRNDPCPCGSGKKCKKCCLGKPGFAS